MIFVANALPMNGGTTFLIRTCREFQSRGINCAVILLRGEYEPSLYSELRSHAKIISLRDFLVDRATLFRKQTGIFGLIDWPSLDRAIAPFGNSLHVMGLFGLIFALRLNGYRQYKITAGVYHQNEFLFQPSPFYFSREMIRLFKAIPPENVIFFNQATQANYMQFYGSGRYESATIAPIGLSFDAPPAPPPAKLGYHIVSVGNLAAFKTYNRHMIEVVASLADRYPDIQYDIYGVGPEQGALRALISRTGMEAHVRLLGALPYAQFRQTVIEADLFVGSGTALLEAAAAGRPALIGIESIQTPETYGFLHEIEGLSYNEHIAGRPKRPLLSCVEELFSKKDDYARISAACFAKAREFSVTRTVDAFIDAESRAEPSSLALGPVVLIRLLVSLLLMAVAERFGPFDSFRYRRDQSF